MRPRDEDILVISKSQGLNSDLSFLDSVLSVACPARQILFKR
jgi:hypothetical protein